MNTSKLLTLLGFAQKSGKLSSGDETCELNLKKKRVKLIVLANDITDHGNQKWQRLCEQYGVPLRVGVDRDTLSAAIGKGNRTVFAVLDSGFARKIITILSEPGTDQGE